MTQIILYLILAVICVALYFIMSKDLYFRGKRVKEGTGHIGAVVKEDDRVQYQIIFLDEMGEQRTAVTPKYESTSRYIEGDSVAIRYSQMNLFRRLCINSVRISDPNLSRTDKYTACLALAGVLIFFMGVRIVSQFIL